MKQWCATPLFCWTRVLTALFRPLLEEAHGGKVGLVRNPLCHLLLNVQAELPPLHPSHAASQLPFHRLAGDRKQLAVAVAVLGTLPPTYHTTVGMQHWYETII